MKKFLSISLIALILLCFTACSSSKASNVEFTVATNDGDNFAITSEDLKAEYENNAASFVNKYEFAEFSFTGTVKEIQGKSYKKIGSDTVFVETIIFEEGIELTIKDASHDDIINSLSVGDRLYVKSEFQPAIYSGSTIELQHFQYENHSWQDESTIRIAN